MKNLKQAYLVEVTRVLVRCDLDVPIDDSGNITDTSRLDASIPTLKYLIENDVFPVMMGHMGRPNGKFDEALSTKKLIPYFDENLGEGSYEILENLRFDSREKSNDSAFSRELSTRGDIYVNESFATCHREVASVVGVPEFLPSYAGLRLEEEVEVLGRSMADPIKPFVAIVGGIKLESKKSVISRFLQVCDYVLVGGKIGLDWKDSIPDNLVLPLDYAEDEKDIGLKTISKFEEILDDAKSVIWSGPLGFCEGGFDEGTKSVAQKICSLDIHSVVGGGDTVAILKNMGFLDKIDFASTGGGAMLQFLVEGTLPGIEALNKYD